MRRIAVCALMALSGLAAAAQAARIGTMAAVHRHESSQTADAFLFGDAAIERGVEHAAAGRAEAFKLADQRSGTASAIHIYLGTPAPAHMLQVALYTSRGSQPRKRLVVGTLSSPRAGAWNSVALRATGIAAGSQYWLAVLGQGWPVSVRVGRSDSCATVSARTITTDLRSAWATGSAGKHCPISAFVTGTRATTADGTTAAANPTKTTVSPPATQTSTTSTSPSAGGVLSPPTDTSLPVISGSAVVGQTLTATTGAWTGEPLGYLYQWQDCGADDNVCQDIPAAVTSSYTLQSSDSGDKTRVVVTAVGTGGSTAAESNLTSPVRASGGSNPAPPSNTAAPTVGGTAAVGDTLTASMGSWSNSPTSYEYQWRDCNSAGATCANISGASASIYTVASGDQGHTLDVVVTASNAGGSGTETSAATGMVPTPLPSAPSNTAAPTVGGTAAVGDTLTSSPGSWSNSPTSYEYQWRDCNSAGASCVNISGATSSSYTVASGDTGDTIDVIVTASNVGGSGTGTSTPTAVATGASGPSVYVSQASAGSGNGSSCANARPASWFNSSSNWGTGNGQVGPGVTVDLCGTISSDLTAQGSGSVGSPITIDFQPGAELSQPVCSGACLTLNNRRYVTVNGGTNGIIQNTANGTGLANQSASTAINADPCTGCTIENLTIQNIYVHSSTSDNNGGQTFGLSVSGSNLTVANNTIDNLRGAAYIDENDRPTDTNLKLYGNNIYDADYGFWLANYNNAGGAGYGPFYFYGNDVHDFGAWDTTSDAFHHDGLMCYSSGSATADIGGGLYLYDNRFGGTSGGSNMTADIFLPGASDGTPCSTASSNIYIFNNLFDHTDGTGGNGAIAPHVGDVHIWNNTIDPPSNTGVGLYLTSTSTIDLRNNLFNGGNTAIQDLNTSEVTFSPVPDYDWFANGGSNAFVCGGYYGFPSGFSHWQSCSGGDSHGTAYSGTFTVNSDGSVPTDSPSTGAGENLYGACNGQPTPGLGALCENIDGVARPSSGAWSAGAS